MKTIKNSKDITTLEVGDKVIFGDLKYIVTKCLYHNRYYLELNEDANDKIFRILHLKKEDFIEKLGINADYNCDFPEIISLETLTAIVSALFKEYEKQNVLPKTWEEFCERNRAKDEYYITNGSYIICVEGSINPNTDRNLCTSKQEAEAFLALMQLRALWHDYVGDFKFNWVANCYFCIYQNDHNQLIVNSRTFPRLFCFPTKELAEQFLTNFKDLLEIAKPLL